VIGPAALKGKKRPCRQNPDRLPRACRLSHGGHPSGLRSSSTRGFCSSRRSGARRVRRLRSESASLATTVNRGRASAPTSASELSRTNPTIRRVDPDKLKLAVRFVRSRFAAPKFAAWIQASAPGHPCTFFPITAGRFGAIPAEQLTASQDYATSAGSRADVTLSPRSCRTPDEISL
jgi:hypothetical protein